MTREQIKMVLVFVPALFFEKLGHEGEEVERKASSWISSSFLSLHLMAMGTYRKQQVTVNGHLIPLWISFSKATWPSVYFT